MTIVPIKDDFESPQVFLLHIAADKEIVSFAMVVTRKTGTTIPVQIGCSRADLAYAGAILTQVALEEDGL